MVGAIGPVQKARVVHRSALAPEVGEHDLVKLMLNVQQGSVPFEPGQEIGFVPPGEAADPDGANLRRYAVDEVTGVPFEDTVDLTLHVRSHKATAAPGVAEWLQDAQVEDELAFYGPFKYPFHPPSGSRANLVMIGAGHGVIPFRWLARKIHQRGMDWMGNVIMLEGNDSGLEHLYQNIPGVNLDQYFDNQTFRAFEALKTRYSATTTDTAAGTMLNIEALVRMLSRGSVYVYIAGYRDVAEAAEARLAEHLRLPGRWAEMKQALQDAGHWREYLYG